MVWVAAVHPNGHNPARFSQRVFQNRPHCILNGFPCTKVAAILDGEAHPGGQDDRGFGEAVKSSQNL